MEKLEVILSIAGTVLGLTITTITFLVKFIKNHKAKKLCQEILDLCNELIPYIETAEKFVHYTGEEKKTYVMTKARQYALENKFIFNEEIVSDHVESLVAFTKKVNTGNFKVQVEKSKAIQLDVNGEGDIVLGRGKKNF